MYDVDRPRLPHDNTVPGSINMDFNGDQDRNILASTKEFCYWWNVPRVSGVDVEVSKEGLPRVTRSVTAAHFRAFLKKVKIPLCLPTLPLSSIFYDRAQLFSSKISETKERRMLNRGPQCQDSLRDLIRHFLKRLHPPRPPTPAILRSLPALVALLYVRPCVRRMRTFNLPRHALTALSF